MKTLAVTCFLAAVVLAAYGETAKESLKQNMKRANAFRCGTPQARSVPADQLTDAQSKVFYPPYTVLHRCDAGSGCCGQGGRYVCGPSAEGVRQVLLHFVVHELRIDHGFKEYIQAVPATNHTECSCRSIDS